jgi:hypothetical protein
MSKQRILSYSQLAPFSAPIYIFSRVVSRGFPFHPVVAHIDSYITAQQRVGRNIQSVLEEKYLNAAQEVVDSSTRPQNAC